MRNHHRIVDLSKPDGLSTFGMIAAVGALVAVVVLSLRIGPHYIDFRTLRSIMEGLSSLEVHEMDKRAIHAMLRKRFKINNLRSFTPREVISIDRNKVDTTIVVSYEIREPLLGNVDVVLVFHEQYSYR